MDKGKTKIEKINLKLRPTESIGLFHDSRQDVRTLMKSMNIIVEKVNEIIATINVGDE